MNFRTASLAAVSGILLAAAFPAIDLHFLAWIALMPLFISLEGQSVKNGFWLGGLAGIFYFIGTVHWVTNSVHFYGGIPLVPASLITLLLCAYLALYPALFGAAAVHLRNNHAALCSSSPRPPSGPRSSSRGPMCSAASPGPCSATRSTAPCPSSRRRTSPAYTASHS